MPPRIRVLSRRELNRALLARQGLLERRRAPVLSTIERLVGLQAQVPRDPYVTLWSRLEPFDPLALSDAIARRRAVRMTLFRGTLHLVTRRDALALYPVVADVMHRGLRAQPVFRAAFETADLGDVIAMFDRLLHEAPRTRAEISREVASRWPELDAPALSSAMAFLPLVQVTPRGLWRTSGGSAFALLEDWLDERVERGVERPPDDVLLRYLAAFGPSTVADAQSWSGLRSLGAAFERLRPRLRTFEDERGRELFDVPRAALPAADVTTPVRFLAEYDNVLLAHKDRSRIVPDGVRQWTGVGWGSVLADGWVSARWRPLEDAVVRVEPFRRLSATERREVEGEARRLAAFLAPDATRARVDLARSRG